MNKSELIAKVAEKAGCEKKTAESVINATMAVAMDAVKAHEDIAIAGFGTLSVKKRDARKGHNPVTGETIDIPACMVPSFKPGSAMKDAANGK